jgi:hypothetical protein
MPQHAALLAVFLHDPPSCLECAATKSGLSVSQVNAYLAIVGAALEVLRFDNERCRGL